MPERNFTSMVDMSGEETGFGETVPLLTQRNGKIGDADLESPGLVVISDYSRSRSPNLMTSVELSASRHSVFDKPTSWFSKIKVAVIFLLVFICSAIIGLSKDHKVNVRYYSIVKSESPITIDLDDCLDSELKLTVSGTFTDRKPSPEYHNLTIVAKSGNENYSDHTHTWSLVIDKELYTGQIREKTNIIDLSTLRGDYLDNVAVNVYSTIQQAFSFSLTYRCQPQDVNTQVVYSAIVLLCVYVLIIFELVHRTLAALLGALAAIAVMSHLNERPSLETLTTWIDYETLSLLFGMMIIVGIFCETGFFDWAAFQAYKFAKGDVWLLITILCLFGAVVSAFLDNVTTILLLTPVTIRLCEVLNLDPRYVLIAEVVFSNIGGAATAVGDPPNVIIVSNSESIRKGITFANFTLHLTCGSLVIIILAYGMLRFMFRNMATLINAEPHEIVELRHEIEIWRRTATRITVATREESLVKALLLQKVTIAETVLERRKSELVHEERKTFEESLHDMSIKYRIRDKVLLVKTGCVLAVVILFFIISSSFDAINLSLGWIAVLGAMWLLVLSDHGDLESLLHKVEWATLLFFAALFILMKCLEQLGLIDFIGDLVAGWIESVSEPYRLTTAIILILWVSAVASSFIDNIPFTTAMLPVLVKLGEDQNLNLPFMPLVWTLAFGTCLGGNGTLIGASANVVSAGIADQHGYGFSFMQFFKVGFPMMLFTTSVATVYLLICHAAFSWNYS